MRRGLAAAAAHRRALDADAPGRATATGCSPPAAEIDGRPMLAFAQDASFAGGSLGERHADTIVELLRLAARSRVPVIGCMRVRRRPPAGGAGRARRLRAHLPSARRAVGASAADLGDLRASAGGGSYAPALTDFVVMTEQARMFLTGPGVVAKVTGEDDRHCEPRRPARTRSKRRLPHGRAERPRRAAARARAARATCRSGPASDRRAGRLAAAPERSPRRDRARAGAQGV